MTDHVISGLVRKRAELAGQVVKLLEDLRHIDGALIVFGYSHPQSIDASSADSFPPCLKLANLCAWLAML
jgi:hypothetical protein